MKKAGGAGVAEGGGRETIMTHYGTSESATVANHTI